MPSNSWAFPLGVLSTLARVDPMGRNDAIGAFMRAASFARWDAESALLVRDSRIEAAVLATVGPITDALTAYMRSCGEVPFLRALRRDRAARALPLPAERA